MIALDEVRALAAAAAAERKRFAGLQAEFARRGFELIGTEAGELYAARWGHAKRLPSLDDAEAFLQRIGGAAS